MLKSLSKKTVYIVITLLAILILFITLYLTKMQVVSQGLNINKGVVVDRLCNYTIYNDFYYHIIENPVENEGDSKDLAKLIPVQATICYDNKNKQLLLTPKAGDKVILEDDDGIDLAKIRGMLERFSETYALIAATQDQDYFQNSYKQYQLTMKELYQDESSFVPPVQDIKEKYYSTTLNLPISNMEIKYFKLNKIKSTPVYASKEQGWQPNIVEWNFNEKDKIYLQYLTQWKHNGLEEYAKNRSGKGWKTYAKLPKFSENKVSNMFLRFDKDKNKATTLFMDSNGYVYILVMKTQNPQGIKDFFDDYLRIAYGINFIDSQASGFDASFQLDQKKVRSFYESMVNKVNTVVSSWLGLSEQCQEYSFFSDLREELLYFNEIDGLPFDERYSSLKERFGAYPNESVENELEQRIQEYQKLVFTVKKASDSLDDSGYFKSYNGCEHLIERCKVNQVDALKCIEQVTSEVVGK